MVNEEKLRTMIQLARYHKEPLHTQVEEAGYLRRDYIRLHLLTALGSFSAAYVVLLLLGALYHFDYIFSKFRLPELRNLILAALIVYLLLMVGCALLSVLVYSSKYRRLQKKRRGYLTELKKLETFYTQSREGNGE